MRDIRFVAEHRGGLLTRQNHRLLMRWAIECSEHVLPLVDYQIDVRLLNALDTAKELEAANARVGQAMKASLAAHAAAREITDPVYVSIARAIGQTVATAHMADHSIGAAIYGLKAIKLVRKCIEEEKEWQNERLTSLLPEDVAKLVLETRIIKEKYLKM